VILDLRDLLATPYATHRHLAAAGGNVGGRINCVGVVQEIARRLGLPPPDFYPAVRAALASEDWAAVQAALAAARSGEAETGFPDGWIKLPSTVQLRDGDVRMKLPAGRALPGAAIIVNGYAWTAIPRAGVICVPLDRLACPATEIWRFEGSPSAVAGSPHRHQQPAGAIAGAPERNDER